MEAKIKYLELIQGVISRMAGNSFYLKGWAVTLLVGIFALSDKDANLMHFFLAYIPILVFWGLDSYYLLQERLYRTLYNNVVMYKEEEIDFMLTTSQCDLKSPQNKYLNCLLSKTEMGFYLPLVLITAGFVYIWI